MLDMVKRFRLFAFIFCGAQLLRSVAAQLPQARALRLCARQAARQRREGELRCRAQNFAGARPRFLDIVAPPVEVVRRRLNRGMRKYIYGSK